MNDKNSPIQPKLLSRINERLVLSAIRDRGPLTRAEMSKTIGVTFPTVAKAVASLLDSNLLEEIEEAPSGPGRPAKRLRLASETSQVIGVTLSDSQCYVAAAALDGVIPDGRMLHFTTPSTYEALIETIADRAKDLMGPDAATTLCLGVCIPGIVDYEDQRAVLSANLPMINGKYVGRDLQATLDVDCIILRDAHAFSLSERLHRKGENASNVAMLDHSEGIGLGLMVNGQFVTGDRGFAGELGHVPMVPDGEQCHCGKKGCLETVASEWALEQNVAESLGRPVKMDEVLNLAAAGNDAVQEELRKMCEYLALGVATVVNLFNPGAFYIYGQSFRASPELFDLLVEQTEQYALAPSFAACRFTLASGGELDGTIASVINYLTDSLVPDLDGYLSIPGR